MKLKRKFQSSQLALDGAGCLARVKTCSFRFSLEYFLVFVKRGPAHAPPPVSALAWRLGRLQLSSALFFFFFFFAFVGSFDSCAPFSETGGFGRGDMRLYQADTGRVYVGWRSSRHFQRAQQNPIAILFWLSVYGVQVVCQLRSSCVWLPPNTLTRVYLPFISTTQMRFLHVFSSCPFCAFLGFN